MDILFVTRKWPPAIGGMEVYATEMVAEWRAAGHRVDLRALPGRADGGAPGALALIGFGLRTALSVLVQPRDWQVLVGGDLAVWPLIWLAGLRRGRAACLLTAHGTDAAFGARAGLRAALYRIHLGLGARLLRRARVAANSGTTADHARRAGFADVTVIPLGCRAVAPEGTPPEGRFVLFAGRLERRKGLSWFVAEVLPQLPPDVRLVVAGPRRDAGEAAALGAPRVDYAGPVSQGRLCALMRGAVAVVIPNRPEAPGVVEGFGLVAVEAAMAGGVVLASRVGGYQGSVIDGQTGRLLPPGDAAGWVATLTEVLGWSPEHRAGVTNRARATAAKHFDWARTAAGTLALARPGGG